VPLNFDDVHGGQRLGLELGVSRMQNGSQETIIKQSGVSAWLSLWSCVRVCRE
jgi:hypothetical protein